MLQTDCGVFLQPQHRPRAAGALLPQHVVGTMVGGRATLDGNQEGDTEQRKSEEIQKSAMAEQPPSLSPSVRSLLTDRVSRDVRKQRRTRRKPCGKDKSCLCTGALAIPSCLLRASCGHLCTCRGLHRPGPDHSSHEGYMEGPFRSRLCAEEMQPL